MATLKVPTELDFGRWTANLPVVDLLVAIGAIAVAAIAGWLAGRFSERHYGPRLAAGTSLLARGFAGRLDAVVRAAVTYVLLAVTAAVYAFGPSLTLLVAAAAGLAIAIVVRHIARGLQLPPAAAVILSLGSAVITVAAMLGGLGAFTTALDNAALSFGRRRISILDVLGTAVLVVGLYALARLLNRGIARWIGGFGTLDGSQRLLAQKLAGLAIAVGVVLLGVDLLGLDLTALAFFSGALGLAIGFGLQKTFGNLIAGLILLMDRSIKPGDVIVVGDQFGQVNRIGIRAVSVLTRDGKEHLIPNEKMMTDSVENWSYSDRNVRIHIPVGVAYGTDLARAQELMLEAARATARVLDAPPPNVWLRGFGDSSVDHEIMVWIKDPEDGVGNVQSAVLNRVWILFKANDIEIPFPQRDVHIRSLPKPDSRPNPS